MRRAIEVSKKSLSKTGGKSPLVGAVLVKNGVILAEAFRGEPFDGNPVNDDHAEFALLEKKLKDKDVSNSILYTTLEPCTPAARKSHKPCADWIIERKVGLVYIGMLDPNPRVYEKGFLRLKDAGIQVRHFPHKLREEIKAINKDFISQFKANPELAGTAIFNYSDNNGQYTLGHGNFDFETKWGKASDILIYIYSDPPEIEGVALATVNRFDEITDASIYDMSSRHRIVKKGGFVVILNKNGYYDAIKVLDIKDNTRPGNDRDEISIEYYIQTDGGADFSTLGARP
jgi:pyrimidine deaminase RibD-like protein